MDGALEITTFVPLKQNFNIFSSVYIILKNNNYPYVIEMFAQIFKFFISPPPKWKKNHFLPVPTRLGGGGVK